MQGSYAVLPFILVQYIQQNITRNSFEVNHRKEYSIAFLFDSASQIL